MSNPIIETRACWQPWESLNVAADGVVYPCCVVNVALEIGSLKSSSLEQIIAGPKALDFKRKILSGNIEELPCAECCNAPMMPVDEFRQQIRDRFFPPLPSPASRAKRLAQRLLRLVGRS